MDPSHPIVFRQEGAWRVGQCRLRSLNEPEVVMRMQSLCEADLAAFTPRYVALDFTGVSYMFSPAIGMVLTLQKRQRQNGGVLAVCGLDPEVVRVFKLARLDRVFEMYPDLGALLSARPQGPPKPVDAPPGP